MGIMSKGGLQVGASPKSSGAHSHKLAHDDIRHISSMLGRLSAQDMKELGLPPSYWRKRLRDIAQSHQLSKGQLGEIDRLIGSLEA
ncbi:hypothetical protein F4827_003870 [Paraburkholderia bannensis]|uniref:Uncharacterized protein n=1 Tax=Paraburkholderia bannensis TaxID=765414 RepID=A0A7W9TZ05_9BURK|nr:MULTISPECIES: hypothetical protein [Paraburkholderia]MBB3258997.1 hypothetical protein [Paraburkholderia sp. WP4_3_2]MBB6104011.1 hypothetical protein [Paraburkholderia bannensis]